MSDPVTAAREEWTAARRAARAVLREPGALPARERDLLRLSVIPQIDSALATLDDGLPAEELVAWNTFVPDAVGALAGPGGLDPGLAEARDRMRRGLAALRAGR